jgi:hypothetical protein
MSTKIVSATGVTVVIEPHASGSTGTYVRVYGSGTTVPTTELIAAVEKECNVRLVPADAIVIEREKLPKITASTTDPNRKHSAWVNVDGWGPLDLMSPGDHRSIALRHLAMAEYATAHPPVSEGDVATLSRLLFEARAADENEDTYTPAARHMLATGKVTVTR